jgi:hypothetical protein
MNNKLIIHAIKIYSDKELKNSNDIYFCQCGYTTKDHEDFILHCNNNLLNKKNTIYER